MTKLEFLDRINDILIGLNTAESDALGSLYDELMRDAGWQQVRIQASIAAMQGMVISDAYCSEEPVGPSYQIKRRKWPPEKIAKEAVAYADFLIAELQKKGGKK